MLRAHITIPDRYVWADLRPGGLGNKLFVWANAYVLAERNQVPLFVTGWDSRFGLRTFLKGGGTRRYGALFSESQVSRSKLLDWDKTDIDKLNEPTIDATLKFGSRALFSICPSHEEWFKSLGAYRSMVVGGFHDSLSNHVKSQKSGLKGPPIAIHVRLADFRKLGKNEVFARVGGVRTPLEYFCRLVLRIREIVGWEANALIYSDGKDSELRELLCMPNVARAKGNNPVFDLIEMSLSKVLICSAGSSFSQWAVFLGEQTVIAHFEHFNYLIREPSLTIFEGVANPEVREWSPLLVANLIERLPQHRC